MKGQVGILHHYTCRYSSRKGFISSFVSEEPHRGKEIDCRKAIN